MLKYFFSNLLLMLAFGLHAQLVINVISIPANTPANDPIYVVGTMNNWNPADPAYQLASTGNGQYSISINPPAGAMEFKFTRGSWASVEGNATGGYLPNRTYTYSGQSGALNLSIQSWEGNGSAGGTAASNVYILDDAYYMPQLNRNRRIWVYLPPDYNTTNKHYPVLYMQDAQNLFDVNTSFSGEWGVDEALNTLFQQGDYGCIVVGIDNGGVSRLDEYSPWVNSQYGGGQGDLYVDFVVETLKPHIDSLYRTLPGRNSTGIMGSSMGGLISMYALIERQDVFSKAGIFSPAFWFADNEPANHVSSTGKSADVRVYFLAGGDEPAYVAQDMNAVADAMLSAGFGPGEQFRLLPSDGQHAEWFWKREFPDAYKWLFANATSSTKKGQRAPSDKLEVYPNPAGDWMRIGNLKNGKKTQLEIISADGHIVKDTTFTSGEPVFTGDLPHGVYTLRVQQGAKVYLVGRLVH